MFQIMMHIEYILTTDLEHAVLGYPVSLDQYALVQPTVVKPGLHQSHGVVLQVVEKVDIPHSAGLRPHPVGDGLVEVTKEPEHLLVQGTELGNERLGRSSASEASDVILVRVLVLVH